ncbi:FHA domain-containing protein [Enemella sp. A6]|uniref:FHA domain-containing protein n=1 Tax=Enemella sp. A6 TaxID=3440152 RepID=UPI003EB760CA
MPFCSQCGYEYQSNARFCSQCGRAVSTDAMANADTTRVIPSVNEEPLQAGPELSPDEEQAINALPQGSSLFLVRRGPDAGSRILVDKPETTAGRHPGSDIFLDDVTVSRHHVRFVRQGNNLVVSDVGSLNGTYVNRDLIDGQVTLRTGDEVQIGKFRLVYFASPHDMS